jgi:hypothetical protein
MSTLKVDQLEAATASTITVPSGQTLDISSATLTPPATMPASSAANLTSIPAANVTGVLPVGVTGGSGLTALGTVTAGTFPAASATALYPTGSILQCKGASSNTNWGTNSTTNETHYSQIDVAITTRGLNSNFYLTARFPTDNSSSTTYGVGLGFRVHNGSAETQIVDCHQHEDYSAANENMYMVARNELFVTTINEAIGTALTFRVYVQFNNGNGAFSGDTGQLGQTHTVMEVQS